MPEIRNPAAPINAPTAPSAGSIHTPVGSQFPRSMHPALAGATGGGRVADVSAWAAAAAGVNPKR
ncbi:MAG: hypothetical protein ABSF67_03560 [Roseiarcus sp.]